MKRLVIIRGNSGSGKTTIATELQRQLGAGTMLISQDVIRRQILHANERDKHSTLELMVTMARFGWSNEYHTVIVEGILSRAKNSDGLKALIREADKAFIYYFDIPFEETLRRHATKPNAHEFGETEMREWWQDSDSLNVLGEITLGKDATELQTTELILSQINRQGDVISQISSSQR